MFPLECEIRMGGKVVWRGRPSWRPTVEDGTFHLPGIGLLRAKKRRDSLVRDGVQRRWPLVVLDCAKVR